MNPFTQFLGCLVELVGAETAAQVVREFAGQTIQFPITDHYSTTDRDQWGFPVLVRAIGEYSEHSQADRKTSPLKDSPDLLVRFANEFGAAGLQNLPHQLRLLSPTLLRLAKVLEPLHSIEPSEIEALRSGRVGS